jgi:hypothetical protein
VIIFWHGELGINSPKLLERLRSLGIGGGVGRATAGSESRPIMQRFSWGPETYAAIVLAGDFFFYLISTAHGPDDLYGVLAVAGACLFLLLVRVAQRLNRREVFILPRERRGRLQVKVSPRFLRSSVVDLAAVTFEWPHMGYIIMAGFYWTMVTIFVPLILWPNTGSRGALDHPAEIKMACAIFFVLGGAMVANIIRTKVFLFRCFIPTRGRDEDWIYISAHDAWRMVSSLEKASERTCFVNRAGAAVIACTVRDAQWQMGRHKGRR